MTIDAITILYILLGILALLIAWIIRLEVRIKRLLAGKGGKSLEDTILRVRADVQTSENIHKETKGRLEDIERRLRKSVQGIDTLRFSAFDEGGNQSFATAFLNEEGDGVVISSLYARERVGIFAKPIKNHSSEYELSKEEKDVLKKAKIS
ncbi:MAG: DUF4446 family protein [Patescibacteria group bacterium]|nr:MAG: DUF4446 family protein [Patescibacteria group bacterium]